MAERKKIPYSERKFNKTNAYRYDAQYKKENYDRINFVLPKGYKDIIKEVAEKEGVSVGEYIRQAIQEKIDKLAE